MVPNMHMEVCVAFFTMKIDKSLIFYVSMSHRMIMKKHITTELYSKANLNITEPKHTGFGS